MSFPVNLSFLDVPSHTPSLLTLKRSAGKDDLPLRDYCIPVNPYFPTPRLFEVLRSRLEEVLKYYPDQNDSIGVALGHLLGLDAASLVLGNGSTELITWINLMYVKHSLAIPVPTFSRWTDEPLAAGKQVHMFQTHPEDDFQTDVASFVRFVHQRQARVAVVCNPNNPTGALLSRPQVMELLDRLADLALVVVDESFIDFSDETDIPTVAADAPRYHNVIVLKSLGKSFGLHGVRLGYAVSNSRLAAVLRQSLPFWNLNGLAETLIRELPEHMADYEASRRQVVRDRMVMQRQLAALPELRVFPSRANFVYLRVPGAIDGVQLRNHLLTEYGCLVRECSNKAGSSRQYFRIACRPPAEIAVLTAALTASLAYLSPCQAGAA